MFSRVDAQHVTLVDNKNIELFYIARAKATLNLSIVRGLCVCTRFSKEDETGCNAGSIRREDERDNAC